MRLQRQMILRSFVAVLAVGVLVGAVAGEERKWKDHGNGTFAVGKNDEQISFRVARPSHGEPHWELWLREESAKLWIFPADDLGRFRELNCAVIPSDQPTVEESGEVLRLSADWYPKPGDLALAYSLALRATEDGVAIELELEPKRDLVLTRGIQCAICLEEWAHPTANDDQVYAKPSAHARLGSYFRGVCRTVLIGQPKQRAIAVSGQGLMAVESYHREGPFEVAATLLPTPDPLPAGTCRGVTAEVGFDTMPEKFPDDIPQTGDALDIGEVQLPSEPVPQYGKIELTVDLLGTWKNPFDPDEVKLDAIVEFPSGQKVCQPGFFMIDHQRVTGEYTENCNRWWMRSDEFGLEWCDEVGWYCQSPAAQLDRLVEIGEELGMYWIFTFDDHKDFWEDKSWPMNPYNQTCGGPCRNVDDWFTSSRAK